MKRGTPDHWKMKELGRLLGIPSQYAVVAANGIMERLWHYTAKTHPRGDIGSSPDWAIADACGWDCGKRSDRAGQDGKKLEAFINALVAAKWLDRDVQVTDDRQGTGNSPADHRQSTGSGVVKVCRLLVHDWADHAEGSVKKYLTAKGLSFFVPTSTEVQNDPALALAIAIAKPEPKPADDAGQPANVHPFPRRGGDEIFEDIYTAHPKKGDRGIASRYLAEAVTAGADLDEILRVHGEYCQTEWAGNDGKFAPKLAQWLLDKGWKYPPKVRGQPAPVSSKHAALDAWANE